MGKYPKEWEDYLPEDEEEEWESWMLEQELRTLNEQRRR